MPAVTAMGPRIDFVNNGLRFASCLQVAVVIRKALHRIRVANVNPFGICSGRVKSDAEWLMQTGCKRFRLLGPAVLRYAAKNLDIAFVHLRQKYVAIRRCT